MGFSSFFGIHPNPPNIVVQVSRQNHGIDISQQVPPFASWIGCGDYSEEAGAGHRCGPEFVRARWFYWSQSMQLCDTAVRQSLHLYVLLKYDYYRLLFLSFSLFQFVPLCWRFCPFLWTCVLSECYTFGMYYVSTRAYQRSSKLRTYSSRYDMLRIFGLERPLLRQICVYQSVRTLKNALFQ